MVVWLQSLCSYIPQPSNVVGMFGEQFNTIFCQLMTRELKFELVLIVGFITSGTWKKYLTFNYSLSLAGK